MKGKIFLSIVFIFQLICLFMLLKTMTGYANAYWDMPLFLANLFVSLLVSYFYWKKFIKNNKKKFKLISVLMVILINIFLFLSLSYSYDCKGYLCYVKELMNYNNCFRNPIISIFDTTRSCCNESSVEIFEEHLNNPTNNNTIKEKNE